MFLQGLLLCALLVLAECTSDISTVGFSQWSVWSSCSLTCGVGVISRSRTCLHLVSNSPYCNGAHVETLSCFESLCPPSPIWNEWGIWTMCSGTCGNGTRIRKRECSNLGYCPLSVESEPCDNGCRLQECPASGKCDCNFESSCWLRDNTGHWRIGRQTPSLSTGPKIDHTFPDGCGHFAYFEASGLQKGDKAYLVTPSKAPTYRHYCFIFWVSMYSRYPLHMGWLNLYLVQGGQIFPIWYSHAVLTFSPYEWKKISVNVDVDFNGGNFFIVFEAVRGSGFNSDIAIDDGSLSTGSCSGPVDGNWGKWEQWASCDVTCGNGIQSRVRMCSSPSPANGGANCTGMSIMTKHCDAAPCPVNGGWFEWSLWSECSKTCDNGTRYRLRECSNPVPMYGGSECIKLNDTTGLEEVETVTCQNNICFPNGLWVLRGTWCSCDKTCGEKCILNNGSAGSNEMEMREWYFSECLATSTWGEWTKWSYCNPTCGNGTKHRSRVCHSINGIECSFTNGSKGLKETAVKICYQMVCPVDGGWTSWKNLTDCSATCGTGYYYQKRYCTDPAPQGLGKACKLITEESYGLCEKRKLACNCQPCQVDSNWGEWGAWSDCDETCGNGTRIRNRTCDISHGGMNCLLENGSRGTEDFEADACLSMMCSTDGTWGGWSVWSVCDLTCGNGTRYRNRTCDAPAPNFGGKACLLNDTSRALEEFEDETCILMVCPVNGVWGQWMNVTQCSKTCGGGMYTQERDCDSPAPVGTGSLCQLSKFAGSGLYENRTLACNTQHCPVDGNWGNWTETSCSLSCGGGNFNRSRSCDNPEPEFGGQECRTLANESALEEFITAPCNTQECPIDGMWGKWSVWSVCDLTCSNGTRYRNRTCDAPAPNFGGKACLLNDTSRALEEFEDETCILMVCPVNGVWGQWMNVTQCSKTCGGGMYTQERDCDSPAPVGTGSLCQFSKFAGSGLYENRTLACNTQHCPVDGNWGNWTETSCSLSCGGGNFNRSRSCDNPEPEFGGQECRTLANESALEEFITAPCNTQECPIDGMWGKWSVWSVCDLTCGNGTRYRNRTCDAPAPNFGGKACLLNDTSRALEEFEDETCILMVCPVNGKWGPWMNVTHCSTTCGGGQYTQERDCDSPAPVGLGNPCEFITSSGFGLFEERTLACNNQSCPVHGSWSEWGTWNACSETCGFGTEDRKRNCSKPPPAFGGDECSLMFSLGTGLMEKQSQECFLRNCPMDGAWGSWFSSGCSVSCEEGSFTRTRHCDTPLPMFGGMCNTANMTQALIEIIVEPCNLGVCPVNGSWNEWSPWTTCSETCGNGTTGRMRSCNKPSPVAGGLECHKLDGTLGMNEEDNEVCLTVQCIGPYDCTFESAPFVKSLCNFTYEAGINRWMLLSGKTPTLNTGPYYDHTYGDSRGYYLYFESSATVHNVLPTVSYPVNENYVSLSNLPPFSGLQCMTFWLHMFHNTTLSFVDAGEFRVEQIIGSQPPIEKLKYTDELPVNDWVRQEIDLEPSPTHSFEIRFYARRKSFANDRAIDDVFFHQVACAYVTTLS